MTQIKFTQNISVFALHRRDLLKWAGAGASAMLLCNFDELHAMGVSDKIESLQALKEVSSSNAASEFFYWFDGPAGAPLGVGGLSTHLRLSIHVDFPQDTCKFVESVILTDNSRKIIAAQRLDESGFISDRRAPYVVFDNLNLDNKKDHHVYYVVRSGDEVTIFRFVIEAKHVRPSRFDYAHLSRESRDRILPKFFESDMLDSNHAFAVQGKPDESDVSQGLGHITTPYQAWAPLNAHSARGRILEIKSDGSFKIEMEPMHGDISADHFMRYFLVLDPVGRVLGGIRREFKNASLAKLQVVTRRFYAESGIEENKLEDLKRLSILDCPHIQLMTEDRADAIARVGIRLR